MSFLASISQSVQSYDKGVEAEVKKVRSDPALAKQYLDRWKAIREKITHVHTPTGLTLPRLALPELDEAGAIARYLLSEGLPGEFPFVASAYREMYVHDEDKPMAEEPTRMFAGLGLAEDTNKRFHYLAQHQRTVRLSTAFDGPTLYGTGSDADGVLGKIGEGGVAIDTVEDMMRLYDGFDLGADSTSVSMTINGPAPIILAMYVAAAKRRFGNEVVGKLRGTIQADVLKEVQAQNECIFPIDDSMRFLGDMVEWSAKNMPRFYPISISGYHIAEAGATPIQQAAYTLSNGFTYVELFKDRGMDVNEFGPRLSFFLDCGLDVEYLALARACRKIWAIGMRDVFGANDRAQRLKLHTQTSGRSLIAMEFKNNLTRTAVELMLAYMNATNSCHSNSADEPFTTPSEEYVKLAAHAQSILLEESGLFRHMMNTIPGSPGMREVEKAVQSGILEEFRAMDELGGVLAAVEYRYQRSQIQTAAHRMEEQIYSDVRPIVGLNRYRNGQHMPDLTMVRTPKKKQLMQLERTEKFKKKNRDKSKRALDQLAKATESGGNVFAELLETVEVCTLGQIVTRLQDTVGVFRPTV